MRSFIPFIFLFTLFSCDKESFNEVPLTTNKLIGSWQVVSNSYSIGGPIITDNVANGDVYTFNIDNTFSYTNSSDSELNFDGTYLLQDDLLILNYVKNGEDVERLLSPTFNGKEIRLSPGGTSFV